MEEMGINLLWLIMCLLLLLLLLLLPGVLVDMLFVSLRYDQLPPEPTDFDITSEANLINLDDQGG